MEAPRGRPLHRVVMRLLRSSLCKRVEGSAVSERVSSIPARSEALRGRFVAPFPLLLLLLTAAPAAAQVGPGEWSPSVEAGVALPDLTGAAAPAAQLGATLTTNLLPGPLWSARAAVTLPTDGAPVSELSLAALATLDALTLVPYAGLSVGTRIGGSNDPTLGVVAGMDRRTERDHATGVQLRFDVSLPLVEGDEPAWSGALLFTYRWIVDSLATPEL